jgi:putative DNA primase/helicase
MVALRKTFRVDQVRPAVEFHNDHEEIKALLIENAAEFVSYIRGDQQNKALSNRNEARFGSHGKVKVSLSGEFRGWVKDFSGGPGMPPHKFLMAERGLSYGEAMDEARRWLGLSGEQPKLRPMLRVVKPEAVDEPPKDTAQTALKIWNGAKGSTLGWAIAERYLREHRGITGPLPAELRGHYGAWTDDGSEHGGRYPALVVAARDEKGDIRRVQAIYLDRETGGKAKLATVKRTFGANATAYTSRFAARVPSGRVLICEGPEDAVSIWSASGFETRCVLGSGNLHAAMLPAGTELVICADGDEAGRKAAHKAARAHTERGCTVRISRPPEGVKDFNELLRAAGEDAVRARIEAAEPWEPDAVEAGAVAAEPVYCEPTYPDNAVPLGEARAAVSLVNGGFFSRLADHWTETHHRDRSGQAAPFPPVVAVNVGTGIGKSHDARVHATDLIQAAHSGLAAMKQERLDLLKSLRARRRAGEKIATPPLDKDRRDALKRPRRGIVAVPRHVLGEEVAKEFRKLGLTAVVWRGYEAEAPDQDHLPEVERVRMCGDLEAYHHATRANAPIATSCCEKLIRATNQMLRCKLYETCLRQKMEREAAVADVVIVPHEIVFHGLPTKIGKFGFLVIDEGFWQKGLRGIDGLPSRLTIDSLTQEIPTILDHDGDVDDYATNDLDTARRKLHRALSNAKEGPLTRRVLDDVGLTAKECGEAGQIEWKCRTDAGMTPGMDPDARAEAADTVEYTNKRIMKLARLWKLVGEALGGSDPDAPFGRLQIVMDQTKDGPVRVVNMRWRDDLSVHMAELPILHLDATMRESLVQAYLPHAQFMTEVQAQMPHVTMLQVWDRAFSAHMLIPKDSIYGDTGSLKPEERAAKQARLEQDNQTRQNHAKRVLWWIRMRARQLRGKGALVGLKRIDVLVICQQGLEDLLPSVGDLPAGVEIAHFNDVAGSDRWKGVACLVQIGRVSPMPSDIDTITGALHGWLPTPCPQPEKGIPWYLKVEQGIRLADGRGLPVMGDAHIDPLAEDVRWSICEGESLQGIGRPRGVNRTEANPLHIDLLCSAVYRDSVRWRKNCLPDRFGRIHLRR